MLHVLTLCLSSQETVRDITDIDIDERISHDEPLLRWVQKQRGKRKRDKLSEERIVALEALPGWRWCERGRWGEMFTQLQEHSAKCGDAFPAPATTLGRWADRQRRAVRLRRRLLTKTAVGTWLTSEQQNLLTQIPCFRMSRDWLQREP